jgi:tetratricopeptide (TPR) repeat protein
MFGPSAIVWAHRIPLPSLARYDSGATATSDIADEERDRSMRRCFTAVMVGAAVASALWAATSGGALAAISEPSGDPNIDPAPCFAAAAAEADPEQIITSCGAVIDNEKTAAADRLRALLARARAYIRKQQDDRAIADYDVALKLDPTLADIFNARGELWRKKGDRPRALSDFGAAIKLNPQHSIARGNYRMLAQEVERLGAQLAVNNKPSFICATAKRAVEKAICADPALANLDREIDGANALAIREAGRSTPAGRELQRQQQAFVATRNASFGRPGYDLQKAMKARLQQLLGADGY